MDSRMHAPGYVRRTLNRLLVISLVLWTAVCAGSVAYHIIDAERRVLAIAREGARQSILKDKIYRLWAAGHGGVYVPITKTTRPNPFLANIKERDISTPTGRQLTLVNPAYMTRQVNELSRSLTDLEGHITSLKPLRPENAPDAWEEKALKAIESGAAEFGERVSHRGTPHYRLMLPLTTEKACLKCHAAQGYRLGELRGGISAAIPLSTFASISKDHLLSEAKHFGGVWLIGVLGIAAVTPFVRRRIEKQESAEEELHRSLDLTRSIIYNEPECVKILDRDGLVRFMNRAGLAMIDAERLDDVLGMPVLDLVVPEHREAFLGLNGRVLAGGSGTLEFEMIGFKGTRRWLETHAVPIRGKDGKVESLLGITRDVTLRKRAEDALRKSEERLREAQRIGRIGNWEYDVAGRTLWWSDEVYAIFGMARSAGATFSAFLERIHPEDRERMRASIDDAVRRSLSSWRNEYRIVLDNGEVRHCYESAAAEFDAAGKVVRRRGIVQDISERKRADEHRQQLEQQLLQAHKIESVGRLAGGIAHDINNMLTPILGYAEMLEQKLAGAGDLREDLGEITSAAGRIRDMTRQLLAFARKQTLEMVRLDLNEVISGFTRMLQMTLRENIAITVSLAPSPRPVLADRSQLEQVIMNLAVNAQDAMPDGGAFMLATRELVADDAYVAGRPGMAPGAYVQVLASDTGIGMDETVSARAFDPFFTTKEAGRGTGLGLATVYGIIKQHGGYIELRSAPGAGSEFTISLPIIEAADAAVAERAEDREVRRGTETILVVEDQEQVLRLASLMLSKQGYRVLTASSGQEALRIAGTEGEDIHLVVSDVIMPDMNGRELYEQLRRIRQGTRILYMSGYPADVIGKHGVLESGINFLRKPFSARGLAAAVRRVIDHQA